VKEDRVFVIQNGANIDLFKPADQTKCKNKFGFDNNDKYVCFVGNLAPWQGLEYLIKASALIIKENVNTKFLIIGDGVLTEALKRMVKDINMEDWFNFIGAVPYEQVPEYINACDVCVAPFIRARNEMIGLSPLKIYEYLSCGKPVIASNIEGVGDFLSGTKSGIAVEPENPENLAKGILELLKNDEMAMKMGRNGREIVFKEHSWDSVARKVSKVFKNLI
jgi:glycosyltransferase involved in cell wall biosynthesis